MLSFTSEDQPVCDKEKNELLDISCDLGHTPHNVCKMENKNHTNSHSSHTFPFLQERDQNTTPIYDVPKAMSQSMIKTFNQSDIIVFDTESSYEKAFQIPSIDITIKAPSSSNHLPLSFKSSVVELFQTLTSFWNLNDSFDMNQIQFYLFRSAMSNIVYKISIPNALPSEPESIILRIYGLGGDTTHPPSHTNHTDSSAVQNQRKRFLSNVTKKSPRYFEHFLESLWMCLLSEKGISPSVYAHFENGRFEAIVKGSPLSSKTIRMPMISREIAIQMAKLHHSTDSLRSLTLKLYNECYDGLNSINMMNNMNYWFIINRSFQSIKHVLSNYSEFHSEQLENVMYSIEKLLIYVPFHDHVFCHSDLQYGNIMCTSETEKPKVMIIDYEYGCFGPRSFDIANHFSEWMADYDGECSHKIHSERYPNREQIMNFLKSYLLCAFYPEIDDYSQECIDRVDLLLENNANDIIAELELFTLVSDLKWAFWGVSQSEKKKKETFKLDESCNDTIEHGFSYIDYAITRINHFWKLQEHVLNSKIQYSLGILFAKYK